MTMIEQHDCPTLRIFTHLTKACNHLVASAASDPAGGRTLQRHDLLLDLERGFEALKHALAESLNDASVYHEVGLIIPKNGLLAVANG